MRRALTMFAIPLFASLTCGGEVPPSLIRIVETSPAHARIAWEPVAKHTGGYRIWRRMAGEANQSWRLVGEAPSHRTDFDDGGLDPTTRYEHRVTAFTGQAESAPSTVVASTTPALTPHLESSIVVPLGEKFAHSPSAVADETERVILAYVLGNAEHRESWSGSSIWKRVSQDGGRTWGEAIPVVTGGDSVAFAKPSLVFLPDGRLGMSYSQFTLDDRGRLPGSGNRIRLFRHSADHGRTWSAPVKMGDGSSNNDAIVLGDDGRLLEPLQTGYTRESEPLALIVASDDLGSSWHMLSKAGAIPAAQPTGESDLAHLGGGRLILLSRHEAPFYCLNFSADNGLTWDGPHTLWLGGGDNPPKIARIPGTETLVAVVHSWTDGTQKKDRCQLASVISTDGGRTWDMKAFFLILISGSVALPGFVRAADEKPDLVVFGGTPGGIACAVRAAREGLSVALVSRSAHLGGSLPSLGALETHYAGLRAPLLDEFVAKVKAHYRETYGEDSEHYRACTGGRMITFEPRVAEGILERMVADEPCIRVYRGFTPDVVEKEGAAVTAVRFRAMAGETALRLAASVFIEAGYDRARFAPILLSVEEKAGMPLAFHHRFLIYPLHEMIERDHIFHGHALPNRKRSWNATNLTGGGKTYPEADEATREKIARQHRDHALGLMWFLQNDPDMPEDLRTKASEWGLAKDEFTDNGNIPTQLYVREARRLVDRAVFTEHHALEAPGLGRAPVQEDSVRITEFSLDSLACTTERLGDSLCDGQLFQMEVSRPGQVPWGALPPRDFDNLIV